MLLCPCEEVNTHRESSDDMGPRFLAQEADLWQSSHLSRDCLRFRCRLQRIQLQRQQGVCPQKVCRLLYVMWRNYKLRGIYRWYHILMKSKMKVFWTKVVSLLGLNCVTCELCNQLNILYIMYNSCLCDNGVQILKLSDDKVIEIVKCLWCGLMYQTILWSSPFLSHIQVLKKQWEFITTNLLFLRQTLPGAMSDR